MAAPAARIQLNVMATAIIATLQDIIVSGLHTLTFSHLLNVTIMDDIRFILMPTHPISCHLIIHLIKLVMIMTRLKITAVDVQIISAIGVRILV